MSPAPLVSVVICTYNREQRLATAMQSVLDQKADGLSFELLVVDNGSADRTRDTVHSFPKHQGIRYVLEPTLGLCRARNTGAREARGHYVAYLDDDAIACPGWLQAIPRAFEAVRNIAVVGGRVEPVWEAPRPSWLSDDIAIALTIVDWSPTPKLIADPRKEWLAGANMAVRAAVLREVGGFHPNLDRVGSRLLSNGDVYLEQRVMALGYHCYYAPDMAIRHAVPPSRLTKQWFRRRYYSQGLSDAVIQILDGCRSRPARGLAAARVATRLLRHPRGLATFFLPTNDPKRFTGKCFTWIGVGHIAGLLGGADL